MAEKIYEVLIESPSKRDLPNLDEVMDLLLQLNPWCNVSVVEK